MAIDVDQQLPARPVGDQHQIVPVVIERQGARGRALPRVQIILYQGVDLEGAGGDRRDRQSAPQRAALGKLQGPQPCSVAGYRGHAEPEADCQARLAGRYGLAGVGAAAGDRLDAQAGRPPGDGPAGHLGYGGAAVLDDVVPLAEYRHLVVDVVQEFHD